PERLALWFDARIDEAMEILRFRLGDEAEDAIGILDAWLAGRMEPSGRRTLVKSVLILRQEFGATSGAPEVPAKSVERRPAVLQEMLDNAKKERAAKRASATNTLQKMRRG
ncbi:MAG: hypothetical protein KDD69_00190, partial [Bdellovibrionales bacterium]|nr:hypothetical protein [Bdellovibrionales bacterium]